MPEQPTQKNSTPFGGRSFDRIAAGYDLAGAVITFGRSRAWVREVARVAVDGCPPSPRCLDIATGTGAFAFELARLLPDAVVTGLDVSAAMIREAVSGRDRRGLRDRVGLLEADALALPFSDRSFDLVVSAYLLRNVGDLPGAFAGMARVTRPGGRIVATDLTPPRDGNLPGRMARWYLGRVAPLIGGLLTGDTEAYRYLAASVPDFASAEEIAELMRTAGLIDVGFRRYALGTMALHWARRP